MSSDIALEPMVGFECKGSLGGLLLVPILLHIAGHHMQILVPVLALSGRDGSMPHDSMTLDEVFDSADRYMEENPICPETQAHLDAYKRAHSTDSGDAYYHING